MPDPRRPRLTPRGEFIVALLLLALLFFMMGLGSAVNGPS